MVDCIPHPFKSFKNNLIYGYCKMVFFNSLEVNYRDIYLFFDDDKATLQIGVFFLALPNKDLKKKTIFK